MNKPAFVAIGKFDCRNRENKKNEGLRQDEKAEYYSFDDGLLD